MINGMSPIEDIFFSHGDHLGSANWITDYKGMPIQYLHYLPYGQLLANQQASWYDERYKFTGKERDEETGYDYFGARYYMPLLYHWTKVDPLVDDYLHISPYAYCNWNPIKYVDPDGRIVYFAPGVSQSFKDDFKKAVKYMNQYKIGGMLYKLHQSKKIYYIAEGNVDGNSEFRPDNNNTITWSSRFAIITEDNLYEMSPVEVLNHEIDHALKYDTDPVQQKKDFDSKDPDYGNLEEKRVIMGSEQETARKLGKLEPGEVTRNNHNGTAYETTSPTSTEPKWSCTPQEN